MIPWLNCHPTLESYRNQIDIGNFNGSSRPNLKVLSSFIWAYSSFIYILVYLDLIEYVLHAHRLCLVIIKSMDNDRSGTQIPQPRLSSSVCRRSECGF